MAGTSPAMKRTIGSGTNLLALDTHRDTHAPANTERGKTLAGIPSLHLVKQGDQDARARGPDRVAQGNGATVDIDLRYVPAEILVDRTGLGGECLVRLDQVEIFLLPTGLLERRARSRDRTGTHDRGVDPRLRPGHDTRKRSLAE